MKFICKKHTTPIRWNIPDDYSPEMKEAAKTCGCGEIGELDIEPAPQQRQAAISGIDAACALLERWFGSLTNDPTLSKDTYDFLVGSEDVGI